MLGIGHAGWQEAAGRGLAVKYWQNGRYTIQHIALILREGGSRRSEYDGIFQNASTIAQPYHLHAISCSKHKGNTACEPGIWTDLLLAVIFPLPGKPSCI